MSENRSIIHFAGDKTLTIQGIPSSVEDAVNALSGGRAPLPLTDQDGHAVYVNWANVLYVEADQKSV
jgi:hypothetical protein